MTSTIKLRDICHARSGDKGDTANIGLVAYDPAHYPWLVEHVTAEAVAAHLGVRVRGPVRRYELPKIDALNFVIEGALGGGVTRSLFIDGHGKGFSAILLDLEIPPPPVPSLGREAARPAPARDGKVVRLGGRFGLRGRPPGGRARARGERRRRLPGLRLPVGEDDHRVHAAQARRRHRL